MPVNIPKEAGFEAGLCCHCGLVAGLALSWAGSGLGSGHGLRAPAGSAVLELWGLQFFFFFFSIEHEEIPARRPQAGSGAKSKGDVHTRVT